ncbi:DUF2586 domain-containing protein [Bowmanella denitrificans]|uniref:DUF2586 domain-containing protein n=1 Tax=Bowmanella denitrificans TaxID=366582 RepID=UPI000C9B179A|nr:DUF2586 domain-containing protein [Bowmanella denitrificans]
MAQGQVIVNTLNQVQGSLPGVERHFLFIGQAAAGVDEVNSLDQQSDLDDLFGAADSVLKTNLIAARLNASENWGATAVAITGTDWQAAVDLAMEAGISPEGIIVCVQVAAKADIEAAHTKAVELLNTHARRVFVLIAAPGIDAGTETWAQYQANMAPLIADVAGNRVAVVPQLHGNDLGVIAGRLANDSTSIADTPMRVASGALVGLGATPLDSDDRPLTNAHLKALDALRFSVPQTYTEYPGMYWGDVNLLDIPGGDYQVIEHLRVVDKAARAVRLLAIARVGNRQLNSTPISIAANKRFFARPLREMASATVFNGEHWPGDIKQPGDDAIQINWPSRTHVQVWLKLTPYNCPKQITVNIGLDLTNGGAQ